VFIEERMYVDEEKDGLDGDDTLNADCCIKETLEPVEQSLWHDRNDKREKNYEGTKAYPIKCSLDE
jgi:hypothetical protein